MRLKIQSHVFVLLLLVISISLLCNKGVAKEWKDNSDLEHTFKDKATTFFENINEESYERAIDLFHFPPEYTEEELLKDQEGVKTILKFIVDRFGKIDSYEINLTPVHVYALAGGGGNIPYWEKHPITFRLYYHVTFEKEGDGYVIFVFSNINEKVEIRMVEYGFSADRKGAKEYIQKMMTEVLNLL